MAEFGDIREVNELASRIVDTIQGSEPLPHPMQAMAALSLAMGAMIASASQLGITKPGKCGQLLDHLFKLAEASAEGHLEVAS